MPPASSTDEDRTMEYRDEELTRQTAAAARLHRELMLQRRAGIKVKLEFDSPQWWTLDFIRYTNEIANQKLLAAAKKYVRSGSVVELKVEPGLVEAKVQGSRKTPYSVRLYSRVPTDDQLDAIKRGLSERALCGAMLLAGEMPREVERVFRDAGVGLVPQDRSKGMMLCGCSEPENICKHIVAVMLVITDAFDRDPFLLLRMRGLDKEDLVASLTDVRGRQRRTKRIAAETASGDGAESDGEDEELPTGETMEELGWSSSGLREAIASSRPRSQLHKAPPSPIFDFPLWRGETSFSDSIRPYYESVRRTFR